MKWAVVVKGWAYRVLAGQGVGLQDPRGSTGRFDGYFDDLEGLYISDSDDLEGIPAYL